jgi:hypothetical protein
MTKSPMCFVVMPFEPELNFLYLFLQRYLSEKHGLRVERGDHRVLTKAIAEKVRDQIVAADLLLVDITGGNPNVFYELGLGHSMGKPVIFLTQEAPEDAPVDIRQYEFIQYSLAKHEDLLSRLDNAVQNVFSARYQALYEEAKHFLLEFNQATASTYAPAALDEFQARVMRSEQTQAMPSDQESARFACFLLPKVLRETSDLEVMRKVMDWTFAKS